MAALLDYDGSDMIFKVQALKSALDSANDRFEAKLAELQRQVDDLRSPIDAENAAIEKAKAVYRPIGTFPLRDGWRA